LMVKYMGGMEETSRIDFHLLFADFQVASWFSLFRKGWRDEALIKKKRKKNVTDVHMRART
jgi:hypothetical protein